MKITLKTEEFLKLVVALLMLPETGYSYWIFLAWLLAPDISMVGYLAGNKAGAFLYNLAHHQGIALAVCLAGYWSYSPALLFAGLVMFAHSSMDRIFGFGLKYETGFNHTHLGVIGKKTEQ